MTAEQQEVLQNHRRAYESERIRLRDPGAIPEDEMWRWVRNEGKPLHDILLGKSDHQPNLAMAWKAADLVGRSDFPEALKLLKSADPAERYWAVIALRAGGHQNRGLLVDYLDDISASVRIEVADWLAQEEAHRKLALERLTSELAHEDWWVALRACRAIELLGEAARPALPSMKKLYAENRTRKGDGPFYLAFSSGAFLDGLGEDTRPWDFSPGAGAFTPEPKKKQDRDRARIGK